MLLKVSFTALTTTLYDAEMSVVFGTRSTDVHEPVEGLQVALPRVLYGVPSAFWIV